MCDTPPTGSCLQPSYEVLDKTLLLTQFLTFWRIMQPCEVADIHEHAGTRWVLDGEAPVPVNTVGLHQQYARLTIKVSPKPRLPYSPKRPPAGEFYARL